MVIKGTSCAGARRLAVHLTRTDTNERAEVREITGVAAEDLRGALLEMEAVAAGTRCSKPFYHASINTRADERLTDEQRAYAIDRLEEKLGLTGQPRIVVVHEKEGREHCHIVWSRIDLDGMRAISDSHNYRKHEEVARDLERTFGHERVQGAHAERDGKERPARTPSHEEMLQADRGAISPDAAKALVTDIWRHTDTGQSFKAALEDRGWLLARGDRRDFVVVDPNGGTHSLARRVEGAKAKDIRARMADVDPASLPSVAEARAAQREREPSARGIEAWPKVAKEVAEPRQKKSISPQAEAPQPQIAKKSESHERESTTSRGATHRGVPKVEGKTIDAPPAKAPPGSLKVIDAATGLVSGLGEFLLDFLSGSPAPQPEPDDAQARSRRQVEELKASRRASNAIENIRRDMEAGQNLKSEDVKSLTRSQQEQIRNFGDAAVRQIVDEARERDERYWRGDGRERER